MAKLICSVYNTSTSTHKNAVITYVINLVKE